jgi:SAM-dependent methyltransferase
MSKPTREEIEKVQSDYRKELAATWEIKPGAKILELGCGQGDMTVALARHVGEDGFVMAVDIADPTYGAPMTLCDATDLIKASDIGHRVEFRFNFNLLEVAQELETRAYDYVVLAHCSWYFASVDELFHTLALARLVGKKLCFAEWNLQPESVDQLGHLLAVQIQGQVEAFKSASSANVRTPLTKRQATEIIGKAGWSISFEKAMETRQMQDGDWEIAHCLSSSLQEAKELDLPEKFVTWVENQVQLLRAVSVDNGNQSLSSYALVAE